jgi:hypothetical protein
VSCVLWVPMFVFIFLYFVSLSTFILDLLCLVDYGFLCFCLYSCILYLYRYKIQEYKQKPRNSQSTRHKRSKVKGDLDTKYKNTDTKQRNPQYTRHKRSKIKGDLDTKYKNINVYCGFLFLCLYSCILYLYHLLFQIS